MNSRFSTKIAAGRDGRAKPTVLIYRRPFLARSETFISDHIESLRRWRPVAAYDWRVDELSPPCPAHCVMPGAAGRLGRLAERLLGTDRRLTAVVRSESVKLIHAHFLTDGAHIVSFASRNRIPLVVTAHGYDATIWESELAKTAEGATLLQRKQALIAGASAIICVSDFIRSELIARGYPAEKLITRPLGVDLSSLDPGLPASKRRGVLYAGRLVEKKGAHRLLDAWSRLPRHLREEGLTIIGDGPEGASLREKAGNNPEITFEGAVSRGRILEAMRTHRVLAFSSMRARNGDSEGLPIVGMEAQALGIPIVAFDDGPAREMLDHEVSGLVVEPGRVDLYAEALASILTSDAAAGKMGRAGPIVARKRFDLAESTAALERIYDDCIAGTSEHVAQ